MTDINKKQFEEYERQKDNSNEIHPVGSLTKEAIIEISKQYDFWRQIHGK